jgi:hypothetical protein
MELLGEVFNFLLGPVVVDFELEFKKKSLLVTEAEATFFVRVHKIPLAIL